MSSSRSLTGVRVRAAPIPDAPPVTIATLSSTWPIVSSPSAQPRCHACAISSTDAQVDTATANPEIFGMDHSGGCHCGNIHVRLRLSQPPEDSPVRACTCSFCRSHNPRIVADPKGLFEVWADDWSLVENYRFGTRSCDFLICHRCGVFIAAVSELTAE